jgi:hypothetical protein
MARSAKIDTRMSSAAAAPTPHQLLACLEGIKGDSDAYKISCFCRY